MAGIYIHIPFCKKRCSYCDFYKDTNISIKSDFIESLKREFSFRASFFKSNTVITTLYFGGGTPSVLNLDEFKEIILELNRIFDLSKN
jgi:Coproporphyrinogen III oxidase and related Fe-S oxidoreductases